MRLVMLRQAPTSEAEGSVRCSGRKGRQMEVEDEGWEWGAEENDFNER